MERTIIEIPRASEALILALIKAGIIEVTENGLKVSEKN